MMTPLLVGVYTKASVFETPKHGPSLDPYPFCSSLGGLRSMGPCLVFGM